MKTFRFLLTIVLVLLLSSPALAVPVKLSLESYFPATFPTVSITIDLADMNDQLEVSRQAALFALSPEGWDLENLGNGGWLQYRDPPKWSGHLYFVDIPVTLPVDSEIVNLFGYELTEFGGVNGPAYSLMFHTDEWVERLLHNIGETPNNYGVISGAMEGDAWHQTPVPDWGRFRVEEAKPVPEPSTLLLSVSGLIALAVFRRKSGKSRKVASNSLDMIAS